MGQQITRKEINGFLDSSFVELWKDQTGLHASGPKQETVIAIDEPWVAAVSWLGGKWFGNITLAMPRTLAREIAAKKRNISESENLSDKDIISTLQELIADSAEKLRALIPGRCAVAAPGVFEVNAREDLAGEYNHVVGKTYRSGANPILCEIQSLGPIDD